MDFSLQGGLNQTNGFRTDMWWLWGRKVRSYGRSGGTRPAVQTEGQLWWRWRRPPPDSHRDVRGEDSRKPKRSATERSHQSEHAQWVLRPFRPINIGDKTGTTTPLWHHSNNQEPTRHQPAAARTQMDANRKACLYSVWSDTPLFSGQFQNNRISGFSLRLIPPQILND